MTRRQESEKISNEGDGESGRKRKASVRQLCHKAVKRGKKICQSHNR